MRHSGQNGAIDRLAFYDKLVMLLSTDWLFEHWAAFGLGVEKGKKERLKSGCRALLDQILTTQGHRAKEYWHVSFAPERILRTEEGLFNLFESLHLDQCTQNAAIRLSTRKKFSVADLELFEDITELFIDNRLDVEIKLDSSVEQLLRNAGRSMQSYVLKWGSSDEIDFSMICLASMTTWDNQIRNLTPDLPTFLSDSVYNTTVPALEFIWSIASEELSQRQRRDLIKWYLAVAAAMTDRVPVLSCLSLMSNSAIRPAQPR